MSKELLSENTSRRIYREEDRILKVFSGDFPKEEVFHEAFINARIEAVLGEMVPKVLSLNLRDGSWTLEKEYAKGRTLQELMEEEPSRKQEYLEKMLELQLQIQSHQVPVLEQLKDKMQRQINELGDIDDGTRYELLTRLETCAPPISSWTRPELTMSSTGSMPPREMHLRILPGPT